VREGQIATERLERAEKRTQVAPSQMSPPHWPQAPTVPEQLGTTAAGTEVVTAGAA
jgi:capsular polysaccharide biosynthesis protein